MSGVVRSRYHLAVDGEAFVYLFGGCGEAVYLWDESASPYYGPATLAVPLEDGWEEVAGAAIRMIRMRQAA